MEVEQKLSQEMDDIGYEAAYTGEEVEGAETFTPAEMSRLWSFENALRQANEVEGRLKANAPQEMWWVIKEEDGTVLQRDLLWRESQYMVDTMREMTFHMYTGNDVQTEEGLVHVPGLVDDPKMKEAADQILHSIHQEKEDAREFELHELNTMWGK